MPLWHNQISIKLMLQNKERITVCNIESEKGQVLESRLNHWYIWFFWLHLSFMNKTTIQTGFGCLNGNLLVFKTLTKNYEIQVCKTKGRIAIK